MAEFSGQTYEFSQWANVKSTPIKRTTEPTIRFYVWANHQILCIFTCNFTPFVFNILLVYFIHDQFDYGLELMKVWPPNDTRRHLLLRGLHVKNGPYRCIYKLGCGISPRPCSFHGFYIPWICKLLNHIPFCEFTTSKLWIRVLKT